MKKSFISILAFTFVMLSVQPSLCRADSPITATNFYKAYMDVKMVQRTHLEGVMGLEIAEFLTSPDNPIDVKAAVINALSWKFDGKNNAELYACYLALLYHVSLFELDSDFLSPDEGFCIGYLMAMDNYFHPENALPLLEEAHKAMKDSFTVSIILSLVKAQGLIESDWCEMWKLTEEVLNDKKLHQDLRQEAVENILGYMSLYKEYCK